jgi:uncharacterized protein (TIRG00374 family)
MIKGATAADAYVVEPSSPSRGGISAGLLIKSAISAAILGALFWKFRNDLPSLSKVEPVSTCQAVALLILQPALIGLRWWIILRLYGSRLKLGTIIAITWVSVFANQFLPASVGGDAVRIYALRRSGERLGSATASVLMDRLIALFALALLVVGFGLSLGPLIDVRIIAGLGLCCALGLAGALLAFRVLSHSADRASRWPLIARLLHLMHYSLRIVSSPARAIATLVLAVAVHFLSLLAFLLIARGLGIFVPTATFLGIATLLTFAQVIPISIGGWGVREAAAVGLFGLVGVEPGAALLSSVVLGISYAVASLPGAVIWPFQGRRRSDRSAHV